MIPVRRRADEGSMAVAMLATLVGVSLTGVLLIFVTNQTRATSSATLRARSLYAAQAALEVAVARIRAAATTGQQSNGLPLGDITRLPCSVPSGQLDAATGYQVTIDYLKADPRSELNDSPAVLTSWLTTNALGCTSLGTPTTPLFALLRATGTASGRSRTVWAAYQFRTTNQDVYGGQLEITGSTTRCVTAPSTVGSAAAVGACDVTGRQQLFAYRTNLGLSLVRTDQTGLGLCLYAGPSRSDGAAVTVQTCVDRDRKQQWLFTAANGRFLGTTDGSTADAYCLGVSAGNKLVVRTAGTNCATFAPQTSVGTGNAGFDSSQLVNYAMYAMCVEYTSATSAHLDSCEESDDSTDTTWDQRWQIPDTTDGSDTEVGQILGMKESTSSSNAPYCLSVPASAGQTPTVVPCSSGTPTGWTRYGRTKSYSTRFQIANSAGTLCLAAAGPGTADPGKLVVQTCNGSRLQKWDADPDTDQVTALTAVVER